MSRATAVTSGCLFAFAMWAGYWSTLSALAGAPAAQSPSSATNTRVIIDKYCLTCHNERLKTAGLALDRLDAGRVGDAAETWEKVVRKLRAREMPPASAPRPDKAAYETTIASLEIALDAS